MSYGGYGGLYDQEQERYFESQRSASFEEDSKKYNEVIILHSVEEWNEDFDTCLFWRIPIEEPPMVTSPISSDWIEDYFTHFSIIPKVWETYQYKKIAGD